MDSASQPPAPAADSESSQGVDASKIVGGSGQCSIEANQTEQLFMRSQLNQRVFAHFAEWCRDNRKMSSSFFKIPLDVELGGPAEGKPERWQIKTIDTGRFSNFRWRRVFFTALPALPTTNDMFALAVRVLETTAVPLMVLLSRYERSGMYASVVSIDAPFEAVHAFVLSQRLRNEIESKRDAGAEGYEAERAAVMLREENSRMRAAWRDEHELGDELYRRLAMLLLHLRSQGMDGADEPPLVMLHSRRDDRHMVVWFRDHALLVPHFHHRIMTLGQPPEAECTFVDWPIVEHSPEQDCPQVMCENPACNKTEGPSTDPTITLTYAKHAGPRDKEESAWLKKRMMVLWREQFQPAVDRDLAEYDEAHPDASPEEKQRKMEEVIDQHEAEADKLAEVQKREILSETRAKLNRCGKCRAVAYCSVQCQKDDWLRHKVVCTSPPS